MSRLRINGVKDLQKKANKYNKSFANEVLDRTLSDFARRLARQLSTGTGEATAPLGVTGNLRQSLRVPIKVGFASYYIQSALKYADDVHKGTGKQVHLREHIPPSLRKWSEKVGIPVWLVVRTLATKGQKANPYFHKVTQDASRKKLMIQLFKKNIKAIKVKHKI